MCISTHVHNYLHVYYVCTRVLNVCVLCMLYVGGECIRVRARVCVYVCVCVRVESWLGYQGHVLSRSTRIVKYPGTV